MYIDGAGLEDFEGCEQVFSESNSVAMRTQHASTFHRVQAINIHFEHWNSDKLDGIGKSSMIAGAAFANIHNREIHAQ